MGDRPALSRSDASDRAVRDAVRNLPRNEHLSALLALARGPTESLTRRAALNAALCVALHDEPEADFAALVDERIALGFENVTDMIFGVQSLVVASFSRPQLRSQATRVIADVERLALTTTNDTMRSNAEAFVRSARQQLADEPGGPAPS